MECYAMNGITEKGSGADRRGQHVCPAEFLLPSVIAYVKSEGIHV
jgi:hypothetical protein